MNPNDKVSLRWRVWIGIILVVIVFGNISSQNYGSSTHELQDSITQLERKIGFLQDELEGQTSALEALRKDVQTVDAAKDAIK